MEAGTETPNAETVARAYFDAVAKRDVQAMVACWEHGSLDVLHGIAELTVPADLEAWFGALFAAFPDFTFEVLDVLTTGEKAAVRWRATGSFNGSAKFEGLSPNGKPVDIEGCDVLTVRAGKVVHNDAYTNSVELLRQLGALPPEGSGQEKAMTALLNAKTAATDWLASRRAG
jgi:predicted ester cyclase